MADPATFPASNSVLGAFFSSEDSLFSQYLKRLIVLSLYYYLIHIVNPKIMSLNSVHCPFNPASTRLFLSYQVRDTSAGFISVIWDLKLIDQVLDQFQTPLEMFFFFFTLRKRTNQYCRTPTSELSCKFQKWKAGGGGRKLHFIWSSEDYSEDSDDSV